ncbi:hypothetical protein [Halanaerobacter jeridensis]|uniref:Uncharacterized protein n=1 Tax=Halanaerobacter jeridensis TaxID=706427 RepID=A0A938XPT4_9FIRM|nr:hypothetical protein [Halanaerobacter jeridensis]MBM7557067.1 hypothetical protein [Halanaerobacter jeridensis]
MEQLHFIFDLDGTVFQVLDGINKEQDLKRFNKIFGNRFIERYSVFACDYRHLVFPGFYSLFRWILNRGDKLYFFSNGIKERNQEAVKKLMKKTFGKNYKAKLEEVEIYSREDHLDTYKSQVKNENVQGPFHGNRKKLLSDNIVDKEKIPYTVLIDNDRSYLHQGEEKNFLNVLHSAVGYYQQRFKKDLFYHFHKSYYICGLINSAIKLMKRENLTLADSLWQLQVKDTGEEFNRNFYYPLRRNPKYYLKGYKILKRLNPNLEFYCDIPETDKK